MNTNFGSNPVLQAQLYPATNTRADFALTAPRVKCMAAALDAWWQDLWMDTRTAYLSQATDHADLEHRMRAWMPLTTVGRSVCICETA
jgi:hypothetical protein